MCVCVCVCVCVRGGGITHGLAEEVQVNESQFLVGLFFPHSKPCHEIRRAQKTATNTQQNKHTK